MKPQPDASHQLDMVTIFSSSNHDADMEVQAIHSVLEANGIPSFVVEPGPLPVLEFEVQVPREYVEEAGRVIAEAQAAGPAAAAEAEAASEN